MRSVVALGLLAGIFFSYELWFPLERTFPRAPVLAEAPVWLERFLALTLIVSLGFLAVSARRKFFFIAAIASLVLLVFFDQNRLQPWVYQYWLLLVVLALQTEDEKAENYTLGLAQVLIAALYFWSGVQKLNFTFSHETLPVLIQNFFPSIRLPFVITGLAIALTEASIGVALLFRKTRNLAVCSAVLMHLLILGLLIAKNYNQIVWIWNAALIALVSIAFWRSDVSLKQTIQEKGKLKIAKIIVAAAVLLPILSFFGLWDMYLSGALYSGNVEVAVVRINENLFEKLPPKAQQVVFQTKTGGEKMLPLLEWAIAEMNVPVYPEQRVFKKVARAVCQSADDKNQTELIIKERPAILDGSYNVTRITCAQLEKNY